MSREPQEVIKSQLGSLMMEVAVLTSQLEKALAENEQLKAQLKKEAN